MRVKTTPRYLEGKELEMIHEVAVRQMERCFHFITAAVEQSNPQAWAHQKDGALGVWQHVIHMIDSLRFYSSRESLGSYKWTNPFGLNYEDHAADPPPMDAVLQYAKETKQHVLYVIADNQGEMLSPEQACPWVGNTYLDRLIYIMRHTTHHVGTLNAVLKAHGCEPVRQDR